MDLVGGFGVLAATGPRRGLEVDCGGCRCVVLLTALRVTILQGRRQLREAIVATIGRSMAQRQTDVGTNPRVSQAAYHILRVR